ncbi:MAG: hypothetical protein IJ448_03495 [Oscillospiraceae bacterium]|nr:hypothetical protein [Oscillospiraceae bacterium]
MKKKIVKILALLLALTSLLSMAACQDTPSTPTTEPAPSEITCTVKVVDALGCPYTEGVIVRFLQGDTQAAMQPVSAEGIASKTLPAGEYTLDLVFTDSQAQYHYDTTGLTLSAENTSAQVVLARLPGAAVYDLYAPDGEYKAPIVGAGCYHYEFKAGMNYFLFKPAEAGTYVFSLPGTDAAIGYYGMPHFVQSQSAVEVIDNTVTLSIKASMISESDASFCVIGVQADADRVGTLAIQRTGEPQWDITDEPWVVYSTTADLTPYTLPEGAKLENFDLTAASDAYTLVKDAAGAYHLGTADGPAVLVYLGEKTQYLDDLVTIATNSSVCKYFYDENGNFLRKESYNECLLQYAEVMDENAGVYPLTDDLIYIIQQRGDHYGWWDLSASTCLFRDADGRVLPGINPDIAWLFACCYIAS